MLFAWRLARPADVDDNPEQSLRSRTLIPAATDRPGTEAGSPVVVNTRSTNVR